MLQPRTVKIKLYQSSQILWGKNLRLLTNFCFFSTTAARGTAEKGHGPTESCRRNPCSVDSQSISPLPTSEKVGQVLEIYWSQKELDIPRAQRLCSLLSLYPTYNDLIFFFFLNNPRAYKCLSAGENPHRATFGAEEK